MLCCCSKKSSIPAAIAGASVILGAAAISNGMLDNEKTPIEAKIMLSEAVYGVWDGEATGQGLPPEGESFTLDLGPGEGGGIGGTLSTTNFGVFEVADATFDDAEKVFVCTLVNQADPNMAAPMVAIVNGDAMVGAVTTPDGDAELVAERRQN